MKWILLMLGLVLLIGIASATTERFIDTQNIDSQSGLTYNVNTPIKTGHWFFGDSSWTWDRDIGYVNVLTDLSWPTESRYRLWYQATNSTASYFTCYAYSSDGLSWVKPNLGLVSYGGNTNNNIILDSNSGLSSAIYDSDGLDGQKYIMLINTKNDGGLVSANDIYTSEEPDCNFTLEKVLTVNSSHGHGMYLEQLDNGKWISYYQHWSDPVRSIGAYKSDTTLLNGSWTDLGILIAGVDATNQRHSISINKLNGVSYTFVPKMNNVIIGPMMLYTSRDETNFTLKDSDWVPMGANGEWDDGQIMEGSLVQVIDNKKEWRFYYIGSPEDASGSAPWDRYMGMAKIGYNRIGSVSSTGNITTTNISSMSNLYVNADSSGGKLEVELLNTTDDSILTGYSQSDSDDIIADTYSTLVTWNGSSALPSTFKIKFYLTSAELYAYSDIDDSDAAVGAWYNSSWNKRKAITINSSMVNQSQEDLPLDIVITMIGFNADASDARFTDSNNNLIPREIKSYNSTTGELRASFKPETISNITNDIIYLYGDNPSATEPHRLSAFGKSSVWPDYTNVHHMNNDPNGDVAGCMKDSSSYYNNGTPSGSMTSADLVDGNYTKGIDYDGSDDYILFPSAVLSTGDYTITVLYKTKSANTRLIVPAHNVIGSAWAMNFPYINSNWADARHHIQRDGEGSYYASTASDTNENLITFKRTSGTIKSFWNGVEKSLTGNGADYDQSGYDFTGTSFWTGRFYYSGTNYYNAQYIYEIRISDAARSDGYIITTDNNINNPTATGVDAFYLSFGSDEYYVDAPIVTLLSMTPSTICQNCTGDISIEYGISHNSPLNNTSMSFIYRDYDHDLSDSNHSIRVPENNLASDWDFDGRILRGANRNETTNPLNFEYNNTITGGNPYTWSGLDENNTEVTIVPVNSTYTKVYINSTIHRVMPQMHYIDRSELQEAPKTTIAIHKTQNVLVKFWNFEIFKGNTDFIGVGYTDTILNSNSALWPSDANPINVYYVSSGYDPTTGGDPLTSGHAVYMLSLNSSEWTDHDYSPHENSSYVRGFIDNNLLELYINTTNISYLYYTSNTPSSKSFYINVTNVATSTNVSFANTNVLWVGDNILSQQSYTPNIWFAFMKANMSFDHKLYVADNNDNWANSTMNRTTIEEALFPPTKSTFHSFHNGFTDYDMNGTYSGTFDVQIGAGSDPDGGNTTQNVSLHYDNGTYISTLANTTCTQDCLFMNVSFNSTPYYSIEYNYTMRVVGTDDEGDTATTWLNVNFSLQNLVYIVSGTVYDEHNKGLSSATITLDSDTTTTASDGTFIFTGITDGTYKLSTFKNPYGTLSKTISVSGAHVTGQDFYYTDKTGGGAGATGPIQIVDVLDVDGEIIGKAIAIGKPGEAWFTIDLVSISNLLSGKDTKNVWNILAIFSIFLMVIGFFDKSKTTRGEFLLVAGLIIIIIFSINRFDLLNIGKPINYSFDIWNGVIIVSAVAFIYGFFFDKSKTNRREFLLIFGFVGIGLYAIYQSKLAIVIGFG